MNTSSHVFLSQSGSHPNHAGGKDWDTYRRDETAAWAEFCDARITAAFDNYSEAIGIAIGTINKRNKKALDAKIQELEDEIQKLREKGTNEVVHSEGLMRVVK